jgi:hypothetical protein
MLQALTGGLIVPALWSRAGTAAFTSVLLDAENEAMALICQAPKTGSIDRIAFRTAATTTGGTVTCTIQGVSATTGDPDGTPIGTGTVAIADTDDQVWKECTLSAAASVTRGALMAVVVTAPSGFNGNMAEMGTIADWIQGTQFPYQSTFVAGAWGKSSSAPCVAVRYTDETYPPLGTLPISGIAATTFNSGSTPDERGLKFTLPCPARLTGLVVHGAYAGGGTLKVYDSDDTTVLTSLALDPEQFVSTNVGPSRFVLPATVTLSKDTAYRATLLPGSVTDNTLVTLTCASAALLGALDGGTAFHLCSRTNGGAWDDTLTAQRPLISLVLDAFDDAAQDAGAVHFYRLLSMLGVGR